MDKEQDIEQEKTTPAEPTEAGIQKKKSSSGLGIFLVVVVLVLVAIWVIGRYSSIPIPGVSKVGEGQQVVQNIQDYDLSQEEGKWHAVFLSNGQVYFGRLSDVNRQYAKLEEVYYLQVQQQGIQQAAPAEGEVSEGVQLASQDKLVLIKFGTELHRPKDEMMINRDHILFWEELTPDSTVVKSIVNYKVQQQPQPGPTEPSPVESQQ